MNDPGLWILISISAVLVLACAFIVAPLTVTFLIGAAFYLGAGILGYSIGHWGHWSTETPTTTDTTKTPTTT